MDLASEILTHRNNLYVSFDGKYKEDAVKDILRVGTSAGGARAKAVIAWNPATNEVRSGQLPTGDGFNGKRDDFTLEDFKACARTASSKPVTVILVPYGT